MALVDAPPGLLFDDSRDHRLAEIYAPCFTLILQLRATHEFGDAETLRQRIKDLLDRSQRDALRSSVSREDIENAKFALVAFIDETLLSSDWHMREHWRLNPLQQEMFGFHDAGNVFYERLKDLLDQPALHAEVMEVYYLCMALGFKGKYEFHDQDRLRILIEDTFAALSRIPGMGLRVLSPHGKPRDQVQTEVRSRLPAWAIVAFVAGVALLIYLVMFLMMNHAADRTLDTIRQADRAPIEATR